MGAEPRGRVLPRRLLAPGWGTALLTGTTGTTAVPVGTPANAGDPVTEEPIAVTAGPTVRMPAAMTVRCLLRTRTPGDARW
jgi:hypothetical protein